VQAPLLDHDVHVTRGELEAKAGRRHVALSSGTTLRRFRNGSRTSDVPLENYSLPEACSLPPRFVIA
jgi:hypothetical protein